LLPACYAGRVQGPGIWIPWSAQPLFYDGRDLFQADSARWLDVDGRLAPGRSRSEARSELSVIAAQQDTLEPGRKTTLIVTDGSFGEEPSMRGLVFWMASLVMGALLLILLIACTNVTVLQLSRVIELRREMGIRIALGASCARPFRMLLTEIFMLSSVAGLLSLYVASQSPSLFVKLLGTTPETPVFQMQPDLRVFGYLCLAALACAAVAGLSPTGESLQVDLLGSMKAAEAASGMGRNRKHGFLVSAQVAMSMTLDPGSRARGGASRQAVGAHEGLYGTAQGDAGMHRRGASPAAVVPPGYLGPWGGNMDYREFGEGVTLYFGVNHPGALLFLGDGHAAQGAGELTGDALETSMEFSFSVYLIKGKGLNMPRAENAEYRMASGIANSLPEALQQATTNLSQCLAGDYTLTPNEIALVPRQCKSSIFERYCAPP
jgi:Acetamidase/Formamidase family/FtsX-like permease family